MDNQAQGKKFAVIIGVGNYPSLPTIANTVTDAGDINDLLTDPARGGLPKFNVRLLTDTQADARGIDNAFNWLASKATAADTVFIFFSGHGLSRAGGKDAGSYLCPYDVDATNLKDTAFSGDDLQKSLSSIKAGKLVLFLDCCYAGGTLDGSVSGGLSRTTYLALANSGQALYSSSGSGELSYIMPDARNSLFTACLLEVFGGKGVSTGSAFISAYDVANYITSQVPARNPKQNPFTLVVAGGFPLVPNPLYQAGSAAITPPPPVTQPAQPPTIGQPTGAPFTPSKPSIVNNVGTGIGSVETISGGNFNFGSGTQNNVQGNQNNVTGTQNNVQGNQYNSGRDQFIGNRNVNTGGGNIHDYGGVQGNVNSGSGNQTTVHTGNINSNQGNVAVGSGINQNYGGNQQQPASPTYNAMTLHQGFRRANLSEDDLRLIGQYLALNGAGMVDYDTLTGANPTFKALSLIQYCQQHKCLTALIDTLNGDESWQPVLGGNYTAWRNWAAGEDSKLGHKHKEASNMEDKTNKDNTADEAAARAAAEAAAPRGTNNTVDTGIGSVSQITGGTFNFYNSPPPNTASNPQSGAQSSQPTNTFTLNQKLAGSLDELSIRNICEYINAMATYRVGASYDDLHGDGPRARVQSLITFCQQRKVLTLLIDGINTVRPDLLGNSYSQWQSWAATQDAK